MSIYDISRETLGKQVVAEIMQLTEDECALVLKAAKVYRQHSDWTPEKCIAAASIASTDGGGVEAAGQAVSAFKDTTN